MFSSIFTQLSVILSHVLSKAVRRLSVNCIHWNAISLDGLHGEREVHWAVSTIHQRAVCWLSFKISLNRCYWHDHDIDDIWKVPMSMQLHFRSCDGLQGWVKRSHSSPVRRNTGTVSARIKSLFIPALLPCCSFSQQSTKKHIRSKVHHIQTPRCLMLYDFQCSLFFPNEPKEPKVRR